MLTDWESWPYLTGLELLEKYTNFDPVLLMDREGSKSLRFKSWKGIISHAISGGEKHRKLIIHFPGAVDILICEIFNDANKQIIVSTLNDEMELVRRFNEAGLLG